jgi:hypothetical protein
MFNHILVVQVSRWEFYWSEIKKTNSYAGITRCGSLQAFCGEPRTKATNQEGGY